LDSFVSALFTPKAYDAGFELVKGQPAPEGTTIESFIAWAEASLPEAGEHPSLIGLPPLSATFVALSQGDALLQSLRKMRSLDDDERVAVSIDSHAVDARPAWMSSLARSVNGYLDRLPKGAAPLVRTKDGTTEPLQRFFVRDHSVITGLLARVRSDLDLVIQACDGARQTNHVRQLLNDLIKGTIPAGWRRYKTRKNFSLALWIDDLSKRVLQVDKGAREGFGTVWLGGLASPSSFITASRQEAAHRQNVSLEVLTLSLEIGTSASQDSFPLEGLALQAAEWSSSALILSEGETKSIDSAYIRWVEKVKESDSNTFLCPVYLNADRTDLLFMVDLPASGDLSSYLQHGVCIVSHN